MEDKDIIDYGEIKVPTSWDEITLKQYQELAKYYEEQDKEFDIRDVIHILCDKTAEEINQLPVEFTEKILSTLSFIKEPPKVGEPTTSINVNGEVYSINTENKLRTGEYVSYETVIKSDKYNFAGVLGVLARREGEIYDSHFENEVLPERIRMFENIPMADGLRVINFFLSKLIVLKTHSQLYLAAEEAINLTAQDIDNSQKNGVLSKLSTKLLMRKLKKLRKSIKSMRPIISNTSHL